MRQTQRVVYQSMNMGAICKMIDPPTKEINYLFSNGRAFYEQIRKSVTSPTPVVSDDEQFSAFTDRFFFVEPLEIIKD